MTTTRFSLKCARECFVEHPHLVLLQGIAQFHSITVEFFGCSGGIYRYFPRGREELKIYFQHKAPGEVQLVASARNKGLSSESIKQCMFQIQSRDRAISHSPFVGNDVQDDIDDIEWKRKMEDIDKRFELIGAPILQAQGKPPLASTFHPQSPETAVPSSTKISADDPARIIQERIEARLLNRLGKK